MRIGGFNGLKWRWIPSGAGSPAHCTRWHVVAAVLLGLAKSDSIAVSHSPTPLAAPAERLSKSRLRRLPACSAN
jgi:hypothetical protein